ncbi:hypothetical protein PISMIDRAFT_538627 [Pisolithus microcarpus 441]|uniref:Uncharacterized protein n=1 Tax=Pisolithus microcarpus 441 TaxID=765257 RepID=A0A0C9YAB3_9AGAM|nr:hypothetical protein PISMIDRAFT_538627 [Pisolithus microcarpus 441]
MQGISRYPHSFRWRLRLFYFYRLQHCEVTEFSFSFVYRDHSHLLNTGSCIRCRTLIYPVLSRLWVLATELEQYRLKNVHYSRLA